MRQIPTAQQLQFTIRVHSIIAGRVKQVTEPQTAAAETQAHIHFLSQERKFLAGRTGKQQLGY